MSGRRHRLNSLATAGLFVLLGTTPAMGQTEREVEEEAAGQVTETFQVGQTFRDALQSGGGGPEMVVVPAGAFRMGSPADEIGGFDREGPVHRVTIGEAFAVGVYEVTRGEYERFVRATGRAAGNECYTFEEGWLGTTWGHRTGRNWRDPGVSAKRGASGGVCEVGRCAGVRGVAESGERGGVSVVERSGGGIRGAGWHGNGAVLGGGRGGQYRHANGADASTDLVDWKIVCDDGHAQTVPVGSYTKNGFGVSDVLGNVFEWVGGLLERELPGGAGGRHGIDERKL